LSSNNIKLSNLRFISVSVTAFLVLVAFFGLLVLPEGPVDSAQAVSGNISTDTVWSSATSIDGTVIVDPGVTLTINSGVTVTFQGMYIIDVQGTLKANGTKASPITFTSSSGSPNKGDWGHLLFKNNGKGWVENCSLQYGLKAIQVGLPSSSQVSNIFIKNNTVSDMSWEALTLYDTVNCYVMDNTITNCGGGIELTYSTLNQIYNNTIYTLSSGDGIFLNLTDNSSVILNNIDDVPGNAIHLRDSNDTSVFQSNVDIAGGSGLFMEDSHRNNIYSNFFTNTSLDGVRCFNGDNNDITGNIAYNNSMNGISLYSGSDLNMIRQNLCVLSGRRGVRLFESSGNWVFSNYVQYCGATAPGDGGIFLEDCTFNTLELNSVQNNTSPGIHIFRSLGNAFGDNNSIFENAVYNNSAEGIYVENSADTDVYNNTCYSNVNAELKFEFCNGLWIDNNDILNSNGDGIRLTGCPSPTVSNNDVNNVNNNGIISTGSNYTQAFDNTVTSAGQVGLMIAGGIASEVYNNDISGALTGVGVMGAGADGTDVYDNFIHNNSGPAISTNGPTVSVYRNHASDNSDCGILLLNGNYSDIYDNYFHNNNNDGIKVRFTKDLNMWDNILQDNLDTGISIYSTSTGAISENDTLSGNNWGCVAIGPDCDLTIINSNMDHTRVSVGNSNSFFEAYYYLDIDVRDDYNQLTSADITVTSGDSSYSRTFNSRDSVQWLLLQGYYKNETGYYNSSELYSVSATDGAVSDSLNVNMSTGSRLVTLNMQYPPTDNSLPPTITFAEDTYYNDPFLKYISGVSPISLAITGGSNISAVVTGGNLNVNLSAKANWNGQENLTFTFTANNGKILTKVITVTVTPVNDIPTIDPPVPDITAPEGIGQIFVNLSGHGSDVDLNFEGDILTWYIDAPSSIFKVTGNNVTNNITLTILDDDYFGVSTIIVYLKDSAGANAIQVVKVNITGVNDPPAIMDLANRDTDNKGLLTLNLTDKIYHVQLLCCISIIGHYQRDGYRNGYRSASRPEFRFHLLHHNRPLFQWGRGGRRGRRGGRRGRRRGGGRG